MFFTCFMKDASILVHDDILAKNKSQVTMNNEDTGNEHEGWAEEK